LILNAADALDGGSGLICIKARAEAQVLRIDVVDNGPGFSQDMLAMAYGIPHQPSAGHWIGWLWYSVLSRYSERLSWTINNHMRLCDGILVKRMPSWR